MDHPAATTAARFGYLDAEGRVAIPATLEAAGDFSDGLALARTEGRWGWLAPDGTWQIAPRFSTARPFDGAFARVEVEGRIAWVDRAGTEQFAWRECVGPGVWLANRGGRTTSRTLATTGGVWMLVDDSGAPWANIGLTNGHRFGPVFDGGATVAGAEGWWVVDRGGAPSSPAIAGRPPQRWSDGLAVVRARRLWGARDASGALAIPHRYRALADFSEGWAFAWVEGTRCAVIDRGGIERCTLTVEGASISAEPFRAGMARVSRRRGSKRESNYVRPDGTWVLSVWLPRVDAAFEHGRARVWLTPERAALADPRGALALSDPRVGWIHEHIDDLGWRVGLREPHTEGVADADGRWVVPPRFLCIGAFEAGRATARDGDTGQIGCIDTAGHWVLPPHQDALVIGDDGVCAAGVGGHEGGTEAAGWWGGRWRLLDRDGNVLRDLGTPPLGPGPLREGRMVFAVQS